MKGFLIDAEFVWGFQSRVIGLSKTPPSFYYPPPPTFLGALAESISRRENLGEKEGLKVIEKLSDNLLAIGLRPLNCMPLRFEDINRIIAIKLAKGKQYPTAEDITGSFDSPARGKTILVSLDGNPPTIRWFLVFKDEYIIIDKRKIDLERNDFWKVHRLGSKESRVSVMNVIEFVPQTVSGRQETYYSFPLDMAKLVYKQGRWENETYINPFYLRYSETENPLKNYLLQKNVKVFFLPMLDIRRENPSCIIEAKTVYKYNEEVVVGRAG
jgi:CRISPR-associated protein Cas5, Apern subtype